MREEWREIKKFPRYKISNFGRILSGFGWLMKPTISPRGYKVVSLTTGNKKFYKQSIHILVLEAFKAPKPSKTYECNHVDGNKLNNHICNLEWVTRKENVQHAIKLGLRTPGRHKKLSIQEIKRIKKLRKSGVKLKILSNHFKASCGYISDICNNKKRKND